MLQPKRSMVVTGKFRDPPLGGGMLKRSNLDGTLRAVYFLACERGQLSDHSIDIKGAGFQREARFSGSCALNQNLQIRLKAKKVGHPGAADTVVMETLGCHAGGCKCRN